ncbi:MAG: DUF2779 domain-containing protein [Bdellovibrionia bacterium]
MNKPRYLTKSRFKLAYECPAKLFYYEQPDIFGNKNRENEFLKALAHGGYQVGALAKLYYPEGIDLEGLGNEEAIAKTHELLKLDKVTIFEAALTKDSFLVKVDILVKDGDRVSLIEVKSKSYDSNETKNFFKKRDPGIDSEWESYLIDISFQTWVANQTYPNWHISSFLMLADKNAAATVDGLHQNFRLESADQNSTVVEIKPGLTQAQLGAKVLREIPVDQEVDYLITQELFPTGEKLPSFAKYLSEHHRNQTKALARISSICKSCEFRIGPEMKAEGLRSAFEECWRAAGKITDKDKDRALIFDIWNCRKTEKLLAEDKIFFDQLVEADLKPKAKPKKDRSLEPYQRQWIQVEKRLNNDPTPYVNEEGLRQLFSEVTYPIHCIDFETTMAAIPFHKGRRPYEQIAFQFSHHILHEDGRVEHADQHLDIRTGVFPNFEFVRRLKKALSKDEGTIFRYATHENTVLRQIRAQLLETPEPDQDELIAFIDLISQPKKGEEGRAGRRNMIDLREIVLEHFFHPLMGGSNSIKKVIPAVLEESKFLREKYSKSIYGQGRQIQSLNFQEKTWIEIGEDGHVMDPYKRLPPVFNDFPQDLFGDEAPMFHDESIDDGGAAMTAWSRMQFTEMSEGERMAIQAALLKYCELDTLSMVWLLEYWRDRIKLESGKIHRVRVLEEEPV